jgi:hypothetical protein
LADSLIISNEADSQVKANFPAIGSVELYYDNSKKFETTDDGVFVSGDIVVGDDNTIKLGAQDDLEIFHNSSNNNSVIKENGSGSLVLAGDNVIIKNTNGTENKAQFNTDASVILYYNNTEEFRTVDGGIEFDKVYKSGTVSFYAEEIRLLKHGTTDTFLAKFAEDSAVGLYYNGVKKFETTSTGIDVTGHTETDTLNVSSTSTFQSHISLGDDDELRFGANNDFKIVHDPNDCRFENSNGDIKFKNTGSYFFFDEDGGETLASFINDGAVNLFHDGSKKLETTSTGINVTGHVEADTLNVSGATTFQSNVDFSDSIRLRVGDGNDLQIYHDGTDSYIEDTGTGSLIFKGSFFKFRDTSNNNIFQAGSGSLYLLAPLSTFNASDIDLDPDGSGVVVFKGNATKGAGQFKLNCEQNSHGVTIKGPPHSSGANYTLTLPNTDGSANQVLKTDGSGGLDWVDVVKSDTTGTTGASTVSNIVTISQADYDAISSPDASTIYYITS